MTRSDLELQARELADCLDRANRNDRMRVQPQIRKIVELLTARGETVPRKLHRIHETLEEDAYDDLFDNMPV